VTDQASHDVPALDADYAGAGFGQRLGFGRRPAVLVVDWINAYLDPESPLCLDGTAALASTKRLVEAGRRCGAPIVFTGVRFQPSGIDGGLFYRKNASLALLQGDVHMSRFPDELSPQEGDITLYKQSASAFFGTALAPILTSLGCDSVVITGVSTSGCVRATGVDAVQHGFIPLVVRDAVADRHRAPHDAALFDLDNKYADVVGESEVLAWFAGLQSV
jgi:maleamate amidohydrolase